MSYHAGVLEMHPVFVVRGIFSRAWHLQNRDGWVLTVTDVSYNGPLAIRIEGPLRGFPVEPGGRADLRDGVLALGRVQVQLDKAGVWTPDVSAHVRPVRPGALREDVQDAVRYACGVIPRGLVTLVGGWADSGGRDCSGCPSRMGGISVLLRRGTPGRTETELQSLQALSSRWDVLDRRGSRGGELSAEGRMRHEVGESWLRRAAVDVEGLVPALRHCDERTAAHHAARLIGLGPGLTPAGDDFLCGLLTGLRVFLPDWQGQHSLAQQLVHLARGRTTSLSHTLLAQAARGVVVEPLAAVLGSMGSGKCLQGLDDLLAIGHSSGSDMLAGACLAAMMAREREGTRDPAMVAPV